MRKKTNIKNEQTEKIAVEQNSERRIRFAWMRSKRVRFITLFTIKMVETFAASVIPSVISVLVLFLNPNERSWNVMKAAAFVTTAAVNWIMWSRYAKMKTGTKQFYLMNGITYLLYIIASVVGFFAMGYLVYSMSFANLRVFEVFGIKTIYSVLIANGIMVIILVCCERFSRSRFARFKMWIKDNGVEKAEMEEKEEAVPMQQDKEIEILSVSEIAKHMDLEAREIAEAGERAREAMPETVWDENTMVKGRGEKFERVEIEDIDNDITEGDFNAQAMAENEYLENSQYSGDALWNSGIYTGRTNGDAPITDYEDEEDFFRMRRDMNENTEDEYEDDSLWNGDLYQGRNPEKNVGEIDDEAPELDLEEELDGLWSGEFYKGRDSSVAVERTERIYDDEMEDMEPENLNNVYDAGGLWGKVIQGRGREVRKMTLEEMEREELTSPEQEDEHTADSLWGDFHQGRK